MFVCMHESGYCKNSLGCKIMNITLRKRAAEMDGIFESQPRGGFKVTEKLVVLRYYEIALYYQPQHVKLEACSKNIYEEQDGEN